MKKIYLVFSMMFAFLLAGQSQTYFQNFDGLTAGVLTAQALGSPWTTWTNAPGGAEDALISNTQSYSAPNSIGVIADDDLIYSFNDLTTGRYKVGFKMFVGTGKIGYYNFLSSFVPSGTSLWAFQIFIYNDSLTEDANGTAAVKMPIELGIWHQMDLIIDLDDDYATYLVDGTEIISYQWSKGAQGTDNSLMLDAIDFYGLSAANCPTSTTSTAGYFIDDINVEVVTAPEAPMGLSAVINGNDVDVTWSAPTATPDSYKLTRNGGAIYSGSNLNFTDVGPWPNDYGYAVRAYYTADGYSHSSNVDSVTIAGGVTRNLVLMEEGTSIYCTYCPGAAMGLRDLIETNNKDAIAIAYHPTTNYSSSFGDSYGTTYGDARLTYYNLSGFPTVWADGVLDAVGGNATTSLYTAYLPMYNERIATPSFHILDVDIVETSANNYTATITVEETFKAYTSGWKLHTALTESDIAQTWGNQTQVDFVCRGMYPSASGSTLDFSSQTTQTVTVNFSTTGFVKNNCEFVIFVQHNTSQLVTQTMAIDMESIVGINELQENEISIYPNPAQDYILLNSSGNGVMEIFDMTGNAVYSSSVTKVTQLVDVRNFVKGIYLVKYTGEDNVLTKKIVVE